MKTTLHRCRRAAAALAIVAMIPAWLAILALVSNMPSANSLAVGGVVWTALLLVLAWGLYKGLGAAAWIAAAIAAGVGMAMIVAGILEGRGRAGILLGIAILSIGVPRLVRLAKELRTVRRVHVG